MKVANPNGFSCIAGLASVRIDPKACTGILLVGQVFATFTTFFTASDHFLKLRIYFLGCFKLFPKILHCNFLQLLSFLHATFIKYYANYLKKKYVI